MKEKIFYYSKKKNSDSELSLSAKIGNISLAYLSDVTDLEWVCQ